MRNTPPIIFVVALVGVLSSSVYGTETPAALLTAYSDPSGSIADIPDGYFESVSLDSAALFAADTESKYDLVLPKLGVLALVHDRTRVVDLVGRVTRWEGHIAHRDNLNVTFVKGVSGLVTGVIDTPAGRVLLGQAGDYIVYKQSRALPAPHEGDSPHIPEALLRVPAESSGESDSTKPAAVAYPVAFNAAALAQVESGGEVNVSLPGVGDFRVIHDDTLAGDMGATTFVGYLKEYGDDFRMIVSYSSSGAQGQISTPYGLYLIETVGRRQWLIDVARSGLRRPVPNGNDGFERHAATAAAMNGATEEQGVSSGDAATVVPVSVQVAAGAAASTDKTRIDVLVLYTPGLENHYGGAEQVRTRIQNLVALANQAYIDSGVDITLRLADAVMIDAPDDTSQLDTLDAITKGTGPYKNVAWMRDAFGADLVVLVRPFSMAQGGLCGTGWVGGTNGASIALYRDQGYSVVSDGRDGGYYCSAYTLAHELGHNMGSVHDRATVAQQNGSHGVYSYSFGYGVSGQFGTIMSYYDPEIGKFSTPDKLCRSKTACGISETDASNSANNALSLNNVSRYIAAYTPEVSADSQMISIAGVVTAQGEALAGVHMETASPAKCTATGDNGSYSCIVSGDWSGDIRPTLSGYTFTPESLSFEKLNDNRTGQNFTAVATKNLSLTTAASPSSGSGGGGALGGDVLILLALLYGSNARRRL